MQSWLVPTLVLRADETYTRKSYLRAVTIAVLGSTLFSILAVVSISFAFALILHFTWTDVTHPKMRALLIAFLLKQGVFQGLLAPLIIFPFSLALNWPRYFFWNRRAKRLQREGYIEVPLVTAALIPDDPTICPPAPRP